MQRRVYSIKPGMSVVLENQRRHRITGVVSPAPCKQYGKTKTHLIIGSNDKGESILCFDSEAQVEVM